ncbi:MAG: N-acetylmuramoyl-L-alanine amidase [Sphaerochaeta sp.]
MAKVIRSFILLLLFTTSLFGATNPFALPLQTIIIDAGHGGYDPGASRLVDGKLIVERELTLDLALRLQTLLEEEYPSLSTVLTRSDDTYLSLEERGRIAYQTILRPATSAFFLSIHINSAEHSAAQGFEVLTKLKNKEVPLFDSTTPKENIAFFAHHSKRELNRLLTEQSDHAARMISQALERTLVDQSNRGIKEQDLWVLNAARMPAVLVEVGFLSNDEEARKLLDEEYRQRIAVALFEGIRTLLSN